MRKEVLEEIEKKEKVFCGLSDAIWGFAELSLKEYKSAEYYCNVLAELGFEVTKNLCGIKTAFCGKYGNGRPVIAVLGEFDALSSLSQEGGKTEYSPLKEGGNGHGCGHNLLGAGGLAAAYGIKTYLEKTGKPGTVIFYGTPGEEGGAGKAFMAKEELWYGVDCALAWHPECINQVITGTCNSSIQKLYKFKGVASHAAGDPEHGRSALDAVELMNVGVNYLREHTKSDARIHYAMIDSGGISPNVVQPTASVLYMLRSIKVSDTLLLTERVDSIAHGAALMTGTTVEEVFIDGCSNTVPNHTLEKLMYDNMVLLGAPTYTKEETEFAANLKATYQNTDYLQTVCAKMDGNLVSEVQKLTENGTKPLNDFVSPYYGGYYFDPGSTDVGDVSWQTPTVQINTVCFPSGAPGHSWQNVSCGKTSIGYKGMMYAAKVIALSAMDIFENPEILKKAKEEWKKAVADGYTCPIPKDEFAKAIEI